MTKNQKKFRALDLIENVSKFLVQVVFSFLFWIVGKPDKSFEMQKAVELYKKDGSFSELFTRIRLWDAPYEEIQKKIPKKGLIIDLGCGDGFLVNYLALLNRNCKFLGIELNKYRVALANKGLTNTKFIQSDISNSDIPKADVILLVHVLHHLQSKEIQESVLQECFKKLNKEGKLLIVEIDYKPKLKYFLTWFVDVCVVPILFDKKLIDFNINYRSENQWVQLLKKIGYLVTVENADKGKPFSNVIITAIPRK